MTFTIINDDLGLKRVSNPYVCESGEVLHFYFDRIDDTNRNDWGSYAEYSAQLAAICKSLVKSVKEQTYLPYPNVYIEDLASLEDRKYTEEQYLEIVKFIQRKEYFKPEKNPYGSGGFGTGMMSVLRMTMNTTKKLFLFFASTNPIAPEEQMPFFRDIKMSYTWITDDISPIVQHVEIFRHPSDFLDPTEKYRGIAMPSHSFAAEVALLQFQDKEYMITHPMRSMTLVMSKRLGQDLHLGTNQDLSRLEELSPHDQELLKKHPPIIHISQTQKIAKEGVNLMEHLESLPDDKVEITLEKDQSLMHFPPMTIGSFVCAIKLTKLSQLHFPGSNFKSCEGKIIDLNAKETVPQT